MRKLVSESLNFKRGENPLKTIGIGINPYNEELFTEHIIRNLPEILGTEEIPADIIHSNETYINLKYEDAIDKYMLYIFKLYGMNALEMWEAIRILDYNPIQCLYHKLIEMGFSE
jgi:hypothetical protein